MNYREYYDGFHAKLKLLGPGLIFAGTAVGVSHLVQSTKAGALFGFELLIFIILIHLIKYPFFEIGSRYVAATGGRENLLNGYQKVGRWAVWAYLTVSFSSMLIFLAAVISVTTGLFIFIFELESIGSYESHEVVIFFSSLILVLSFILLTCGHYVLLEQIIKTMMVLLAITTVIAVLALILGNLEHHLIYSQRYLASEKEIFDWSNTLHIVVLIGLLGWLPAPLEAGHWLASWNSSKAENTAKAIDLKTTLFDFRVGYISTALLAVAFLTMGALIMHENNITPESDGIKFAEQLLKLYELALGSWTFPIVATAVLTAMFSTMLSLLDAYPRTLSQALEILFPERFRHARNNQTYFSILLVAVIGTIGLLNFFTPSMEAMVIFATCLAFITAPIFAILNVLAMYTTPKQFHPDGKLMLGWYLIGILVLIGCSVGYLWIIGINLTN